MVSSHLINNVINVINIKWCNVKYKRMTIDLVKHICTNDYLAHPKIVSTIRHEVVWYLIKLSDS